MLDEKEQEKPQEEEESYSFLQETIKPKKISRKMLIQQFVRIALYGLIFGGVASLGFFRGEAGGTEVAERQTGDSDDPGR